MSDVTHDYEFVKLHPDHLDAIYSLYIENNSFFDEDIGRRILSAERDYAYDDFLEILSDDKVFGFIINERVPCQEFHNYSDYEEETFYVPVIRGFLVYELVGQKYNVLFMETDENKSEYYKKLLDNLKNNLKDSKKAQSIEMEVFENRFDIMKEVQNNKFLKKSFVRASKGLDSHIFEFKGLKT